MKALILGGGVIQQKELSYCLSQGIDIVIAADRGLEAAENFNLNIDEAVGDFDSISTKSFAYWKEKGIPIYRYPSSKDESDMELAFALASQKGCKEIYLLGALAGRVDHELANLFLLLKGHQQGICCKMLNQQNCLYFVHSSHCFLKKETYGDYFSFFAFSPQVSALTLSGFCYPMMKKNLYFGDFYTISNILEAEEGFCFFQDGTLLCVESRDE